MTDDHTHEPEDREAAPPSPPEVAPSSRPPAVEPASPPPRNPGAARGPAALVASPARPVRLATPAHRAHMHGGRLCPHGRGAEMPCTTGATPSAATANPHLRRRSAQPQPAPCNASSSDQSEWLTLIGSLAVLGAGISAGAYLAAHDEYRQNP